MGGWNFIDKTGQRFGSLVAIKYLGDRKWLCQCDCGNTTIVRSASLVNDPTPTHRGIRSCGCGHKSKLTKNQNFFEKIDSEEKAYILGMLASDGTITDIPDCGNYTIKLVLQNKDRNILEKIKNALNTQTQIKEFESTTKLPQGALCTSKFCSLTIHGKQLVRDIEKLGVTPAKSKTLLINYALIPQEFKKDFWRGLIDGDGSFGIYGKKQILSLTITTSLAMSEATKNEILKIFPSMKINYYHAIGCDENTMRLMITAQDDVYKFLSYVYENSQIFLDRKYQDFLKIKEQYN